ncbi:MAG TPA: hypothetical protein PK152_08010 [Anaerolineales bacterium]|nr:hypothetical protein [Anaerolineae bacterium]HRJ54943.1 hypothetical protein [Anaerolineales bacterium]HRK89064.1 hypothetical protein [Anaerolineales bacterium]
MASSIPKQQLIKAIVRLFSESKIRSRFGIKQLTEIEGRLWDIRKDDLEGFLSSTPKGDEFFIELKKRYPHKMPRTFFLVKVAPRIYTQEIANDIAKIAKRERGEALFFNSKIRAVFLEGEGVIMSAMGVLEIPIAYERMLEYQIGDPPDSDRYGEIERTYAVEHAFIWLLDGYSHGIVCCSDLTALQAILKFSQNKLNLPLSVPNMPEKVFSRLIEKTETSSATFSGFPAGVPTVTIYAKDVARSAIFQELENDPGREQTAGFFRDMDGDLFASFGISKRYARIWTPWHYSKPWLVNAGKAIIKRTQDELSAEFEKDVAGYLSYFSNVSVMLGDKKLNGGVRKIFQKLLEEILIAHKHGNEINIDDNFILDLIKFQSKLDLQICVQFDCQNCGGGLGRCPDCLVPYSVKIADGEVGISCAKCKREISMEFDVSCECGSDLSIANFKNHIQIFPGPLLQNAMEGFISQNLDELNWSGAFVIDGTLLKLLRLRGRKKGIPGLIKLGDLDVWKSKAKIEKRRINNQYVELLNITKEKCFRNGVRPTLTGCKVCTSARISEEQFHKRKELCLPRIFGLPIEKKFDGIHHGREIADIKYKDTISGISVHIGIHLKSRVKSRPQKGLGRSVYSIKSLYTQTFYSAYQTLKGEVDFDVIGISIPNPVSKDVIDSIQVLINKLGYSLIVLEEKDWLQIFDAALEASAFNPTG